MVLTFKCHKCNRRKYFEKFESIAGSKVCISCVDSIKLETKKKEENYSKHLEKKHKRRKEASKLADETLRKKLDQKKLVTPKVVRKDIVKEDLPVPKQKKPRGLNSEKQIKQMSNEYDTLLYIHVTVKRIKAIEWRYGKKKILLNKEREIRHTHKGGFSQEKFQKFVD